MGAWAVALNRYIGPYAYEADVLQEIPMISQ